MIALLARPAVSAAALARLRCTCPRALHHLGAPPPHGMATVAAAASPSGQPGDASTSPSPAGAIDFMLLLQKLKTTKRTGWVRKGVDGPESIADHMYRMGMMAMLLPRSAGVDVQRCVRMALVHDVAEAIVGDITPHCKVSPEEKRKRESDAIVTIQEMLGPETDAAKEVAELWHEYEAGSTPEGKVVKDLDKLEMIIQAHEYEQAQPGHNLQEFFDSTAGKWRTETGRAWAAEVVARREQAQQRAQQQQGTLDGNGVRS